MAGMHEGRTALVQGSTARAYLAECQQSRPPGGEMGWGSCLATSEQHLRHGSKKRVAVSALCRCASRRAAGCRAPVGCSSVAGCSCRPAAGGGGPVAPAPCKGAPGGSGSLWPAFHTPHIRCGVSAGLRGRRARHRHDALSQELGAPAASRASRACMQLCGSRLSGANNRFRGGFCPQRFLSVEGALGILIVGLAERTMWPGGLPTQKARRAGKRNTAGFECSPAGRDGRATGRQPGSRGKSVAVVDGNR